MPFYSPVAGAITANIGGSITAVSDSKDNGAPGLRPEYHPHYYGAFVIDPEGNNIEAVCHVPE